MDERIDVAVAFFSKQIWIYKKHSYVTQYTPHIALEAYDVFQSLLYLPSKEMHLIRRNKNVGIGASKNVRIQGHL